MPDHVLADARLADVDAELEQFAVNVRSAPERILLTQHANQLANLFRHRRTAGLAAANPPAPVPLRCQSMTVAVLMMEARDSQPFQTEEIQAQKKRSAAVSLGRFTERWRTPI